MIAYIWNEIIIFIIRYYSSHLIVFWSIDVRDHRNSFRSEWRRNSSNPSHSITTFICSHTENYGKKNNWALRYCVYVYNMCFVSYWTIQLMNGTHEMGHTNSLNAYLKKIKSSYQTSSTYHYTCLSWMYKNLLHKLRTCRDHQERQNSVVWNISRVCRKS